MNFSLNQKWWKPILFLILRFLVCCLLPQIPNWKKWKERKRIKEVIRFVIPIFKEKIMRCNRTNKTSFKCKSIWKMLRFQNQYSRNVEKNFYSNIFDEFFFIQECIWMQKIPIAQTTATKIISFLHPFGLFSSVIGLLSSVKCQTNKWIIEICPNG